MDQCVYDVVFEDFTKRHFIKSFEKKYKTHWNKTRDDIIFVCRHIEKVLLSKRADEISSCGQYKIVKLDFAVFGQKESPKASGNRCILFVDTQDRLVRILLVYSKTDIPTHNETQQWKNIIREEYPEITKKIKI